MFFFTIKAPKNPPVQEENLPSPILQGHGEKVLVVEDAPLNYDVVSELLSKVNINCDHALSGFAALNMCEKADADYYKVIFMDIHMPVMDGYETSRKLKEMGITTPIIALTATSMDYATQQQYQDLFADFVFKPFKYDQLYRALSPYINTWPGKEADVPVENPYAGKADAIENLGNNSALYEKHLAKFKRNYANTCDELEHYLASDDREGAKRLAHSVKGLAATLGLTYLARSAEVLETEIGNHTKEDFTPELTVFRDKLSQITDRNLYQA